MTQESLTVLGATGSIGTSTLDLVRHHPDRFRVDVITAHSSVDAVAKLAHEFRPKVIAMGQEAAAETLREHLCDLPITVEGGPDAMVRAAEYPTDRTMSAIVGAAGLAPTLAAIQRGTTVMLANKECLICAGDLMIEQVQASGSTLLPVDSEHNAIFQVFEDRSLEAVERLILTASGGPFRGKARSDLLEVTPEQAVAHPNWSMGPKVSVDSATLMNKGLEVIEAFYLYPVSAEQIEVVVHPQSIIHSMVEYSDGSVLAQMGVADMRIPIAYGMGFPDRISSPAARLDFATLGALDFMAPDYETFACLQIARDALVTGGTGPLVLNAANEIAVGSFLANELSFLAIADCVKATLDACLDTKPPQSIESVAELDHRARVFAREWITARAK